MNPSRSCDVLIVGGGPGGSTLAHALRGSGLDVLIADKQSFPRDKVCAGWVTPGVFELLEIDRIDYARSRTLQPIHRFHFGIIGASACTTTTTASEPISYGILRREFDHYLLQRSATPLIGGEAVRRIERNAGGWLINDTIQTRLLVGAGGHFCPVAKHLRHPCAESKTHLVTAKEAEFGLDEAQARACPVAADIPEIYFAPDFSGYGWIFRKGDHLNVGLGLLDAHALPARLQHFERWLQESGRLPFAVPAAYRGHAYKVYDPLNLALVADDVLLLGDAIGLAHPRSGEGIRPAVESALLAAETILRGRGDYRQSQLEIYEQAIRERFRNTGAAVRLPNRLKTWLLPKLVGSRWFVERQILDHWLSRQQTLRPVLEP